MLDFFDSLSCIAEMDDETVEKLENLTPIGYFKKIYNQYKEKYPSTTVVDFFTFIVYAVFSSDDIECSSTDMIGFTKIEDHFYVKLGENVTNVALYDLERRINER